MATKVVVCPECESPVEAGRFSCSSCGAVVAAVATVARSFAPAPAATPTPVEEVVPEPAPPAEAPLLVDPVDVADDGWDATADEPVVEEVASPEPEPEIGAGAGRGARRRAGRRRSGRGVRAGATGHELAGDAGVARSRGPFAAPSPLQRPDVGDGARRRRGRCR